MKIIEGQFTNVAGKFAIVAARFNQLIVDRLVAGAVDAFTRHGLSDESLDLVYRVHRLVRIVIGRQETCGFRRGMPL